MPVRLVKRFRAAGVLAALALALPATLGAQPVSPVAPPTPEQAPIAYLVDLSSGQTLYARDIDRRFIVVGRFPQHIIFQLGRELPHSGATGRCGGN